MSVPIPEGFDAQPFLSGATLQLTPLKVEDFGQLYAAASDPLVWAGHPAKDRHLENIFRPYFEFLLRKQATLAARNRETGEVIGCSAYYVAPGVEDDMSIGFTFLRRDQWGGTVNRELKALMLDHAFETFDTVWFHIGPGNIRSQMATAKIGAIYSHEEELDLSNGKTRMACFRLRRDSWRAQQQPGAPN